MNIILLIFFAIPILVIVVSIALQKLLKCPGLVASIIFAIFLVITFIIGNLNFLVAAIVYAIIAFITAFIVCLLDNWRYRNYRRDANRRCGGFCNNPCIRRDNDLLTIQSGGSCNDNGSLLTISSNDGNTITNDLLGVNSNSNNQLEDSCCSNNLCASSDSILENGELPVSNNLEDNNVNCECNEEPNNRVNARVNVIPNPNTNGRTGYIRGNYRRR